MDSCNLTLQSYLRNTMPSK